MMEFHYPVKEKMHIHSKDGELCEAVIHKKIGDNDYLAEHNGVFCHTIYNPFVDRFYVGDKYAVIEMEDLILESKLDERHKG